MSPLGDRIRILREDKAYQQSEFAKRLGIASATLSRYETGERKPDYKTLEKIADFFDVSIDYLLGRTNIARPLHSIIAFNENTTISIEEYEFINELKKYPVLFKELTSNPEKKIKEIIKLYNVKNIIMEEKVEYGSNLKISE